MFEEPAASEGKGSSGQWAECLQECLGQWLRKRKLKYAPSHVSTGYCQTSTRNVEGEAWDMNHRGDLGEVKKGSLPDLRLVHEYEMSKLSDR